MKKLILVSLLIVSCNFSAAHAALVGFTSNPTSNSIDWATQVSSLGGSINSNVNFEGLATGALDGNFYIGSDGVTLAVSGDVGNVVLGSGPGQGNSSPPTSIGEGPHAESNYLFDGESASSLIISFDTPVLGVGLTIIDFFDPDGTDPSKIEAFTGQNGSGTSIGMFSSEALNFHTDNEYFMGLISTDNNIGSLVFSDGIGENGSNGDTSGIDDIVFATSAVPIPGALWLLGSGLIAIFSLRKKAIN